MVTTQQIQKWITDGELWRFYKTKEWISLKNSVLAAWPSSVVLMPVVVPP